MSIDKREQDEVREFRLEGLTLAVVGGVLLALVAGAFWAGRWYERRVHPLGVAAGIEIEDPLENVVDTPPPTDVGETADFFDRPAGAATASEPQREVAARQPAAEREADPAPESRSDPSQPAPAGGPADLPGGDWFVQVSAGRDRNAAEILVRKLKDSGFPVRLFTDRVEGDTLYRVRVGGYDDEAAAREVVGELQSRGFGGAWPVRVD